MKLKKTSNGAFCPSSYSLERLVYVYTLVVAYPKRCAVHKADSSALAKKYLLDKYGQRYGHIILKFDKVVIGDYLGQTWVTNASGVYIHAPSKNASENDSLTMKQNHDNHHLRFR